jgi:hypothetical protein
MLVNELCNFLTLRLHTRSRKVWRQWRSILALFLITSSRILKKWVRDMSFSCTLVEMLYFSLL